MERHYKRKHLKMNERMCKDCYQSFSNMYNLKRYVRKFLIILFDYLLSVCTCHYGMCVPVGWSVHIRPGGLCIGTWCSLYIWWPLCTCPYPQSWQTQQISGRKFGKNEEIFGIWEEISWLATDNCSPQRAVQSLGIERKFFLSKWLKIRAIFNFNLSNVLNPKYYRVSNQLLWTFSIDILLV